MPWFILVPTTSRYLYVLGCVYAAIFLTPCGVCSWKLLLLSEPAETTVLVNKQQCNTLYITYVLQDATYFLVLFLEWVCLHSRQALFLEGVLLQ